VRLIAVVGILVVGFLQHGAAAADAARGRQLALDPRAGDCAICHVMPDGDATNQGTIGPPLRGLATRYDAATLRRRIADPKTFDPESMMPVFGQMQGLNRVARDRIGKSILDDAQIDDIVAYLLTP
jgi:L-cysteine S-thiosulfotransferase